MIDIFAVGEMFMQVLLSLHNTFMYKPFYFLIEGMDFDNEIVQQFLWLYEPVANLTYAELLFGAGLIFLLVTRMIKGLFSPF